MTRCPCTRNVLCRPGTSFFYKVLSSLKQLQSHKKYCNGAGLDDLTKFMDKTYNLSGDLVSQVEHALCYAESSRFVIKKKNLYALVTPAATLQFTPSPCVKAKLERIQQIFNSKWYEDSKDTLRRSSRKTRKSSYSPPHFLPRTETKDSSATSKSDSKSKAILSNKSENNDTSMQASIKSYLKSFKFCKCRSSSSKTNHSPSRDSSKEKRTSKSPPRKKNPCSTSSGNYSKRKRRGSRPSRSKKKIRVANNCSQEFSKRNPCSSQTSLNENPVTCDESESDSSEC